MCHDYEQIASPALPACVCLLLAWLPNCIRLRPSVCVQAGRTGGNRPQSGGRQQSVPIRLGPHCRPSESPIPPLAFGVRLNVEPRGCQPAKQSKGTYNLFNRLFSSESCVFVNRL